MSELCLVCVPLLTGEWTAESAHQSVGAISLVVVATVVMGARLGIGTHRVALQPLHLDPPGSTWIGWRTIYSRQGNVTDYKTTSSGYCAVVTDCARPVSCSFLGSHGNTLSLLPGGHSPWLEGSITS